MPHDGNPYRAAGDFIRNVGFPVAAAIALFLVLIGAIPSPLSRIDAIQEDLQKHRTIERERIRLERHICRSLAVMARTDIAKCDPNGGE